MKKKSLVVFFIFALIGGSFFSTNVAEAKSVSQLEKEIKTLKATNAKQKKQISAKDKEIKSLISTTDKQKSDLIKKNKTISDLNKKLVYTVAPLKTKVAYQGNEISGNYQVGSTSVPAVLDYKGVKYSPVNMIGDLLNTKAFYNKSKNTVFFGAVPNGSYMSDLLTPYYSSDDVLVNKDMTMGGMSYNKGYQMIFWGENHYSINLEGKYSDITGYLGIDDDSYYNNDTKMKIYGDGELLGDYELENGGLPLTVNIDVSGVKKLEIYHASGETGMTIDFANVVIK